MRQPQWFHQMGIHTLNLISPPQCPACHQPSNHAGLSLLCPQCQPVYQQKYFCMTCGHCLPALPWMIKRGVYHCRACVNKSLNYNQARNLGVYKDQWKNVILALKCRPNYELVHQLSRWSIKKMQQWDFIKPWQGITIVPERNGAQSGISRVTYSIAKQLRIPFARLLEFKRKSVPQHTLNRTNRLKNMLGSMRIKSRKSVFGNWLVVDDVYTTGATVQEVARIMKSNGACRVDVLTLARGLDRRMQE